MSEHRFMLSFSFIFICCWPIYFVLKVLTGLCSSICLQFIRVSSCLLSFATLLSRRWLELNTPFLGPSLCCWWFTLVYWPFPHSFVRYSPFSCLCNSSSTCFFTGNVSVVCWRKNQFSCALYYFGTLCSPQHHLFDFVQSSVALIVTSISSCLFSWYMFHLFISYVIHRLLIENFSVLNDNIGLQFLFLVNTYSLSSVSVGLFVINKIHQSSYEFVVDSC